MQYCSLQHWTLFPSPVTSTTGYWFCFGSVPSIFLELFLHSSPVACWALTDLGRSSFSVLSFLPFHTVHGVLKARIPKWFAIPFSNGPHFCTPETNTALQINYTSIKSKSQHGSHENFLPCGVEHAAAVACVGAQLCPTLCHCMDCSLPVSSLRGIVPGRILEWVTLSSSRGSS